MNGRATPGFTIIEIVLFIAISGLMLIGILAILSNSISNQRYSDSVRSFEDFLQGQYAAVNSTTNTRTNTYKCDSTGVTIGIEDRGSSNCTIIGRFITSSSNGKTITTQPIFGTKDVLDPTVQNAPDEITQITRLNPIVSSVVSVDNESYTLSWDTSVYHDPSNKSTSHQFSMAIVRVPMSGISRTYIVKNSSNLANTIANHSTSNVVLCVDSDGLSSRTTGVTVNKDAVGSTGVTFLGETTLC